MSSYCMKCKKKTGDVNPKVVAMPNGRKRVASTCEVCHTKKSRMVSKSEGQGFLGDLASAVVKPVARAGVDLAGNLIKSKLIGSGAKRGRKVKPMPMEGEGFLGDIARAVVKPVARVGVDFAGNLIKDKLIGNGARKRGRPRKGEGLKEDILQYAKDVGSKAVSGAKELVASEAVPFVEQEAVKGIRNLSAAAQRKLRGQGFNPLDLLPRLGGAVRRPPLANQRSGQMPPPQVGGGFFGDVLKAGVNYGMDRLF